MRYFVIAAMFLAASCSVSERPISYGTDDCDYCKMTIMDHRYGSELVTGKGKIYVFDSAECLIDFMNNNEGVAGDSKLLRITPYTRPGNLFDATRATFLVSRKMPSPMGAYLTAFSNTDSATAYQKVNGGTLYDWETLKMDFTSIKSDVIKGND